MKNGKLFRSGMILLLALILCLWTAGACSENAGDPAAVDIFDIYEIGKDEPVEKVEQTDKDYQYELELNTDAEYVFRFKDGKGEGLKVEPEDRVGKDASFDLLTSIQYNEFFSVNKISQFRIYISSDTEDAAELCILIRWKTDEAGNDAEKQQAEPDPDLTADDGKEGGDIEEIKPESKPEPSEPEDAPDESVRTSSFFGDRMRPLGDLEWSIPSDFARLSVRIYVPDEKTKISVKCNDEDVPFSARVKSDTGADGKKVYFYDKEDLTEYVRGKLGLMEEDLELQFAVTFEGGEKTPEPLTMVLRVTREEKSVPKTTVEPLALEVKQGEITSEEPKIEAAVNRKDGTIEVYMLEDEQKETIASGTVAGKNEWITLTIEEDKKPEKNTTLFVQYTGNNGEASEPQKVSYLRRWNQISITEPSPGTVMHLYYDDWNSSQNEGKAVVFKAAGEDGKEIKAVANPSGAQWNIEKTEDGFSVPYSRLQECGSILFTYGEEDQKENDREIGINVRLAAEASPEDNRITFAKHSLIIDPVDDDDTEIHIRGAIPNGSLNVKILIPEEKKGVIADARGGILTMTMVLPAQNSVADEQGTGNEDSPEEKPVEPQSDEGNNLVYDFTVTADQNGECKWEVEESYFPAGTIISVSGTDDYGYSSEATPVKVEAAALDPIVTDQKPHIVNGETIDELVVEGQASPNRPVIVSFAGQQKTVKADESGAWKASFETYGIDDGEYSVDIQYKGREGEQSTRANVIVDTECKFWTDWTGESTAFKVEEGQDTLTAYCGELFDTITLEYKSAERGTTFTTSVLFGGIGDTSVMIPSKARMKDEITIHVKDINGNEADYPVKVVEVYFEYSLTDGNGNPVTDPESFYLTDRNELKIQINGAAEMDVEISCRKENNEKLPLASRKTQEEFILNAEELKRIYGEALESGKNYTFTISLHRTDFENDENDREFSVHYDPACSLRVDWPEEKNLNTSMKSLSGQTDPNSTVYLTVTSGEKMRIKLDTAADSQGIFRFDDLKLQPSDTIEIYATDPAGNRSEGDSRKLPSSKAAPILLLALGILLLTASLIFFLNNQKKLRQLEEINRAKTATVQERNKKR